MVKTFISSGYIITVTTLVIICGLGLYEYTSLLSDRAPARRPSSGDTVNRHKAYKLIDDYSGSSFFDGFNFETAADPTHGHVRYQSRAAAKAQNLTYLGMDGVTYIHVDHKEFAGHGRKSVRISTKKQYTRGLFVLDLVHMPVGCGTWPAFWTTAPHSWPALGEIDILEGVNLDSDNAFTLHTGPGCSMSQNRDQVGHTESTNCDVNAWNQWPNQGCGVKTQNSFGSKFNEDGGAHIVMEWSKTSIRMWIFKRDSLVFNAASIVDDVNADRWGMPDAIFDATSCDIEQIFRDHVVIINTTLCGDWCGQVYGQSSCPGSDCNAYVTQNPAEFKDAYWAINSLKVYQEG